MKRTEKTTAFVCQQCGKRTPKWTGRCPECQQWNTLVETVVSSAPAAAFRVPTALSPPEELSKLTARATERMPLPINEFNRVLGGGIVPGSLVLVSGEPGIGKSTLLLQAGAAIAKERGNVVYATGEETSHQIKLRAQRLGISGEGIYLLAETDLESVLSQVETLAPKLLIIDSIQTVYLPELESSAGSVTQIRESTMRLMHWAKASGIPVFITGHVTKEGTIAGPRLLEHIVDVVLHFEGESFSSFRLLRSVKNRYGSTNEVGVFEMQEEGLAEVDNPSRAFLSQRWQEGIGSTVVPTLEGSRPLLIEIQALTSPTAFGMARRTASGIDFNRLLIVTAVLTRRMGLKLGNQDVIVNVIGGMKIDEPAADLGIAMAIASSYKDSSVDPDMAVLGELGLSGEVRAVSQIDRRIAEVARLGFKRCLIPKANKVARQNRGIELVPVSTIWEAVRVGLVRTEPAEKAEQD